MQTTDIEQIKKRYSIVGRDIHLDEALGTALQVARTDLSVLIQGESGVGKEIIPRIIHDHSPRKTKRYIAINCGSIPEGTIDSELFGHMKGSFTGAFSDHEGYFGAADGGTLFLDEVGELPLSTQARLLRVLETGEYIRVGSNEPRHTNVRIVAATNVNMQRAIRMGKFREDLYFRLCTISLKVPPLRDRGNDVVLLFKTFALNTAQAYGIPEPLRLTAEAEQVLRSYQWPGNIRQLRNLAEQMSILCADSRMVTPEVLARFDIYPGSESTGMAPVSGSTDAEQSTYEQERPIIFAMLNKLNKEVEELKQRLSVAGITTTAVDVPTLTPARVLGELTPSIGVQAPAISQLPPAIAQPSAINHQPQMIDVTNSNHHFRHTEFGDTEDDEAELIEERQDLNLERMERKAIEESLKRNHYRRKQAAVELGISERTLYRKIKDYGIEEN